MILMTIFLKGLRFHEFWLDYATGLGCIRRETHQAFGVERSVRAEQKYPISISRRQDFSRFTLKIVPNASHQNKNKIQMYQTQSD